MKQQTPPGDEPDPVAKARHGYRNEVNWEGGSGRQSYSNQGTTETPSPASGAEFAEGNRAGRSGQNQGQLERARGKP